MSAEIHYLPGAAGHAATPIESLASWSPAREVNTARGRRLLRKAVPGEDFWAAWRACKESLKAAGVSLGKNERSGAWEACWWQIPPATRAASEAAIAASAATDAAIDLPCPPGLAYLPYQRAGIAYGLAHASTLLADEPGLGKTIQAAGIINGLPDCKSALVICPASLKLNWQRELAKWLVLPRSIAIADGSCFPGADIVIINYDIVARHRAAIDARAWDLLVVDEASYCKTPGAARTQAILGKRLQDGTWQPKPIAAARRLLMTGTPILSRPVEIWPLVRSLDPLGLGRSYKTFTERYCAAKSNGYGIDVSGASNLEELQRRLRASIMVRRRKADVLAELPPKRRQLLVLQPDGSDATAAISAELAAAAKHEAAIEAAELAAELAKAGDDADAYATAVAALRKVRGVAFSQIAAMRHRTALAKIPAAIAFIKEALESENKLVVFGWHRDVLAAIAEAFGDAACLVTGETALAERQAEVDRFQQDSTCKLFVGSIAAAGVGLTLTAASHVIFVELDWTPAAMTQAEDRCHRIGQVNNVLVQHLVFDGSLDARIAEVLVAKQAIIEAAMDGKLSLAQPEPEAAISLPASASLSRKRIEAEAASMTPERTAAIHAALRQLAGCCDGARELDGAGFSKVDAGLGHALAALPVLTARQAVLGLRLARRYRRQLPAELIGALGLAC